MSWPIPNTHTHTTKPPWSYLHWNIFKEMNIDTNEKWSEHEPETVTRQHHNLVANTIQTDIERKAKDQTL